MEFDGLYTRTEPLIGKAAMLKLRSSHVLVVGVGGVGGYAVEFLCRAGVGRLTLIDGDRVDYTNLNRQVISLNSTLCLPKVEVAKRRLLDINPELEIDIREVFLSVSRVEELLSKESFDFIIDAIDSVAAKCALITQAHNRSIPIISSMGAGNRLDCSQIMIDKLCNTHHDGLSKAVRQRIDNPDILKNHPVVFSPETHLFDEPYSLMKPHPPCTISYLPAAFGCYLAQYAINKLIMV